MEKYQQHQRISTRSEERNWQPVIDPAELVVSAIDRTRNYTINRDEIGGRFAVLPNEFDV